VPFRKGENDKKREGKTGFSMRKSRLRSKATALHPWEKKKDREIAWARLRKGGTGEVKKDILFRLEKKEGTPCGGGISLGRRGRGPKKGFSEGKRLKGERACFVKESCA